MASHHEAIREFATLARKRLVAALIAPEESRYLQLLEFFEAASGDDRPPLAVAPAPILELVALPGPMVSRASPTPAVVEVSAPVELPPTPVALNTPEAVEATPALPRLSNEIDPVAELSNDWLAPPTGEPDADELAAAEPELPALDESFSLPEEAPAEVGDQSPADAVEEVAEAFVAEPAARIEAAPEPVADEVEVEVEVALETSVEVELEAASEPEVAVAAASEPEVEVASEPEIEVEATSEPEVEVEAASELEPEVEAASEPEVEVEAASEPEVEVEAASEPEVEVEAASEPEVEVEAASEPALEIEAAPEPVVEVEESQAPSVAAESSEDFAAAVESDDEPVAVVESNELVEEPALVALAQEPSEPTEVAEEPVIAIDLAPAESEAHASIAADEPPELVVEEAASPSVSSEPAQDAELSIAVDEAQLSGLLTPSIEAQEPAAAEPSSDDVHAAALLSSTEPEEASTSQDEAAALLTPAAEELEVDLDEQFDPPGSDDATVRLDADEVARLLAQVRAASAPSPGQLPESVDTEATYVPAAAPKAPLIAPPEPVETGDVDEAELLAFATGAAAEPDLGAQVAEQVASLPEGWDTPEPEPQPEPEPTPTWQGGWEQPPSEAAWGTSSDASNAWGASSSSAWGEPAEQAPAAWDAPAQPPAAPSVPGAWDAPVQPAAAAAPVAWDAPAPAPQVPASWDVPAQPPAAPSAPGAWDPPTQLAWGAPTPAWGETAAPTPSPAAWDAPPSPAGWDSPAADWAAPAPASASGWEAAVEEEPLLVPEDDSPGDWLQPVAENPDAELPEFGGESAEAPPLASAAELLSDLAQADWARQQETEARTEPAQQPVGWGSPMAVSPVIEGDHRIVLHTLEGSVKRGVATDLDLSASVISLAPNPGQPPTDIVPMNRTKALFFLLQPGERAPVVPPNARRVKVTFVDGRQVEGFMGDDELNGFFLLPIDGRTATARVFVFNHAVRAVS